MESISLKRDLAEHLESMGGSMGEVGGPLPTPAHGVPSRYDGVTRPKDVLTVPIAKLVPDSEQPRSEFDDDELQRLAESLRSRGQLQPIRVRWDAIRELWVIVSASDVGVPPASPALPLWRALR